MKRLLFLLGKLKSTFWFTPVLIILTTMGMAVGMIYLDSVTEVQQKGLGKYLIASSHESARSILSIISAAMIGVAGTVFSLTLVALSLASSQFGSRLLKNFMYVPINQVVLGTYISTFIYCLIVLNSININKEYLFVPSFSVLFALLAAVANIVLLIVFIHHTATSIQADYVISNIYKSLSGNVKTLFPEVLEEKHEEEEKKDEAELKENFKYRHDVAVVKGGYLQYMDGESFLEFAVKHEALIELYHRPGDYLVAGMEIATIYTDKKPVQDEFRKCKSFFLTGKVRTLQHDIEHSILQMVEVACRALSPGINDPYTAISCIDNLTSAMCHLSGVKFPSRYRYDKDGNLRLIARSLTYEGVLDAAFNQIRQFGKAIPAVSVRLMEALIVIYRFSKTVEQKRGIKKHARMVLYIAEKMFDEPNDLKDLKERSSEILKDK